MAERQYTPSTRTAPELRSPPKRMGVPIAAAPVDATTTRRRSGNAGDLDGSTPASNPVPLQKIAVGKPGYDARVPSPPRRRSGNAGDLDGSTPASNPVPLQKIAVGKPGYDATRRRSGNAGDLDGSTPASNPVPLQKIAVGKPGYDARVPSPLKNKPSRPASGRPPDLPFSRKSPEAAAKQVVANAAAMGTPKAKPTPAPKQSWWDKFSEDHKLSAAKSYANYKKLMESM